jgi:pimeloyl-ACP methyl ester carboxylesterase
MSSQRKPTIVFCHGIWADGSCFNKVIPTLQADGHEVIAVQYGLDSFEEDVAAVKRTLNRVGSPVVLVGHSYGGATITASGVDDRVAGLVYIGAVAPDVGETVQEQLDKYPSDIFTRVEVADGRAWMLPSYRESNVPSVPRRRLSRADEESADAVPEPSRYTEHCFCLLQTLSTLGQHPPPHLRRPG